MNTYMEPCEMDWMDNDIGYQCLVCLDVGGPWEHGDPPTCEHKPNHGKDHSVWTYSTYLGPYTDGTGKLWDLGICMVGASPSLAMVYGPENHEYISGPLLIERPKPGVERETQRRWVAYKFHGATQVPYSYLLYTLDELESLPTLKMGHFSSLKVDTGTVRVLLSRCTVDDGEPYNNKVTIECLDDGVWQTRHTYQAHGGEV